MRKEKQTKKCKHCEVVLKYRHKIIYCSNKCQQRHRYETYIKKWKCGVVNGSIGIRCRTISHHIRRYLAEKYKEKCSGCGWGERHIVTRKVPLEIDHIDGNAENNREENLRLICPNCHSLTLHFRNLNKGKGRAWRLDKYHASAREKRNEFYFVNIPDRRI